MKVVGLRIELTILEMDVLMFKCGGEVDVNVEGRIPDPFNILKKSE